LSRLRRMLTAFALARGVLRARHPPPPPPEEHVDPSRYETGAPGWAELALAALLAACGLCLAGFAVLLMVDADTQLLGATAGAGLACLAAALILAGLRVAPRETTVEHREIAGDPAAVQEDEQLLRAGADGVSRRRLILGAAGVAGAGAIAAAAAPVTALGPSARALDGSPWRRGVALVDEDDRPVVADDLEVGSFLTAFPRGADKRELGSPVVVVRVDPAMLGLPAARRAWAPEGLLAFSKICTHAGCAVSLFRYPTYEPTSSPPALVCPCHYSTFDVRRAGEVVLGPAGRRLPQLPLAIDAGRRLVAGGPLSGSVGPAWWGTRRS
jgi:ubiquinol-cytochrome c reductase iron-sulfur subunit